MRAFILGPSILALLIITGSAQAQNQTPATPIVAPPDKKATKAPIYDDAADPRAQIKAALAKAKANNRRVFVQWGANWCSWCHLLHEKLKSDKVLAKEMLYEYDYVLVDVGHFDKNMDLVAEYNAALKDAGIPYITILSADDKPVANQESGSLESSDKQNPSHDTTKVLNFLKANQAAPRDANAVLQNATAVAAKEGKRTFVHFGAPWCGWCHRLEDWMAKPDIAAILSKEFVDCPIDIERDTDGQTVRENLGGDEGGIPWTVVVDSSGKPITTSDAPGSGNIGFPYEDPEIAHFETMLKTGNKNLTDSDIAALITSLKANKKSETPAEH